LLAVMQGGGDKEACLPDPYFNLLKEGGPAERF